MKITHVKMARLAVLATASMGMAALSQDSEAVVFNFSGVSGSGSGDVLHARAEFLVSGTTLTIHFSNTDDNAAFNGADVLSSLYFNLPGNPTLSNGNATVTPGSSLVLKNNGVPSSTNPLNNEWFWKSPSPTGMRYAFGATGAIGFNRFESFDAVFHGGSGAGGATDDYGIIPVLGQTAGSNTNVYAKNSMTFTFTMSSTINEAAINHVFASYSSGGTTVLAAPEPGSLAALAIGGLALFRLRRRK